MIISIKRYYDSVIFYRRGDLHQAFPEASSGDYRRLLEWALGVVQKRWVDSDYEVLKPFTDKFKTLLTMAENNDPTLEKWDYIKKYFERYLKKVKELPPNT